MELIKLKWLLVFLVCLQYVNTINGLMCCHHEGSQLDGHCELRCEAKANEACASTKVTKNKVKYGEYEKMSTEFIKGCEQDNSLKSMGCVSTGGETISNNVQTIHSRCACNDKDNCNQYHASAERVSAHSKKLYCSLVGTIIGLATFVNLFLSG